MSSDTPSSVPGSIAGLLSLLNSTTPEELADAADNVQSIAQDKATKDMVREAGGIPLLAKALQQDGSLQQQAAVGALQNLCRGNQQNKNAMREADVIQPLVEIVAAGFVSATEEDVDGYAEEALEALETLEELTFKHKANGTAVVEVNGVNPIAEVFVRMPRKSRATKTAGAALLNIARGTEAACAAVGNADDVPATLVELINTAPSKLAQGLAFELLSVLAAVEANLKPLRPTLSPLLDALEKTAAAGQSWEACRSAEALLGIAKDVEAFDVADIVRIVLRIAATMPKGGSASPAGPKKPILKSAGPPVSSEKELERQQLLMRLQAVLAANIAAHAALTPAVTQEEPQVYEEEFVDPLQAAVEAASQGNAFSGMRRRLSWGSVPKPPDKPPEDEPSSEAPEGDPTASRRSSIVAHRAQSRRGSLTAFQAFVQLNPAEKGLLDGATQLAKKGARPHEILDERARVVAIANNVAQLEEAFGEETFKTLKEVAERALRVAMQRDDVVTAFGTMALARALSIPQDTIEAADEFLKANPEEVAGLEAAEAEPDSARKKKAGRKGMGLKAAAMAAGGVGGAARALARR